jgi:hypothetical protein
MRGDVNDVYVYELRLNLCATFSYHLYIFKFSDDSCALFVAASCFVTQ